MKHNYKCYCDNIESVENYDKAKADDFNGWECHHRLETHNPDGERRLVDITASELIALDMYYHRPSEELIFMRTTEHKSLHHKGLLHSEATKRRLAEASKGNQSHKGHYHSEEAKRKMSEAWDYDKHCNEDFRKKISEAFKVLRWFNNGLKSVRAKECPEGFVPGRLTKRLQELVK